MHQSSSFMFDRIAVFTSMNKAGSPEKAMLILGSMKHRLQQVVMVYSLPVCACMSVDWLCMHAHIHIFA